MNKGETVIRRNIELGFFYYFRPHQQDAKSNDLLMSPEGLF